MSDEKFWSIRIDFGQGDYLVAEKLSREGVDNIFERARGSRREPFRLTAGPKQFEPEQEYLINPMNINYCLITEWKPF